jgi:hypothetical protein
VWVTGRCRCRFFFVVGSVSAEFHGAVERVVCSDNGHCGQQPKEPTKKEVHFGFFLRIIARERKRAFKISRMQNVCFSKTKEGLSLREGVAFAVYMFRITLALSYRLGR